MNTSGGSTGGRSRPLPFPENPEGSPTFSLRESGAYAESSKDANGMSKESMDRGGIAHALAKMKFPEDEDVPSTGRTSIWTSCSFRWMSTGWETPLPFDAFDGELTMP